MKIIGIFLNPEIRTGGHRRYLELLEGLGASGHDVHLFYRVQLNLKLNNVVCHPVSPENKSEKRRASAFLKYIKDYYRDNSIEFKSTNWIVIFGETHLLPAIFLKKKTKASVLFSYRSDAVLEARILWQSGKKSLKSTLKFFKESAQYYIYGLMVALYSKVIVFQSNYDRINWNNRHWGISRKAKVIGGNIGLPWYKTEYENINSSQNCRNLLYIGSINKRKGIEFLIEGFSSIHTFCPSLKLTIAGFGPDEEKIRKLIKSKGLQDKTEWLGRVKNPFSLYTENDLLVVPSLFDSYPNTVLEAIHTGCPVIGSSIGGIKDMLKDDAFLFPPADSEALAKKIRELCQSDTKYLSLKENLNSKRDSFHFDWAARFEDVMKESG